MGQYYIPVILGPDQKTVVAWFENSLSTKLMEQGVDFNYVVAVETMISPEGPYYKHNLVWAGDYADPEEGTELPLYYICKENHDDKRVDLPLKIEGNFNYLVNHTKKMYVNKANAAAEDRYGDDLHALPFFMCEGNGRGGGDFKGWDPKECIGTWARDALSVEKSAPEGYTEVPFVLRED
jgi:hypothetical protein